MLHVIGEDVMRSLGIAVMLTVMIESVGITGSALGQDVAICTSTLTWPNGRSSDYEFRLVFSRWRGKVVVKGWEESLQVLNDDTATVHAVTGQVRISVKDTNGVVENKLNSGIKGFAAGSPGYFTAVLFGGGDGNDGGSILYPYTLVFNGDKPGKPLVLSSSGPLFRLQQDGAGTCR